MSTPRRHVSVRRIAEDGVGYTFQEFVQYYVDRQVACTKWVNASVVPTDPAPTEVVEYQRRISTHIHKAVGGALP